MTISPAKDRGWLYVAVLARSIATGMIGVLLGIYLAQLQFDGTAISIVVGTGLGGAAFASLIVTRFGASIGHRRALLMLTSLTVVGAILLSMTTQLWALCVVSFIGMVNGMGRDRGAALVIEQAALPSTTTSGDRTMTFARYNVLQDVGHALGSLLAVIPSLLQLSGLGELQSFRSGIAIYALLSAIPLVAYLRLSAAIEPPRDSSQTPVAAETKTILWKISALFSLDSLGGGFLTTAFLAYFFHERFGVGVETMGILFFIARILNAVSHFGAAWLAKRIGLVNTMVFTHIPSSLLLATVPFMPNFPVAAALFLLREGLVEMDVPTRQSYVMAVVRPHERTVASGVTHLVRLGGWALAPFVASLLITDGSIALPLIIGAAMKIIYDIALWRTFRHLRPPEETPEKFK